MAFCYHGVKENRKTVQDAWFLFLSTKMLAPAGKGGRRRRGRTEFDAPFFPFGYYRRRPAGERIGESVLFSSCSSFLSYIYAKPEVMPYAFFFFFFSFSPRPRAPHAPRQKDERKNVWKLIVLLPLRKNYKVTLSGILEVLGEPISFLVPYFLPVTFHG